MIERGEIWWAELQLPAGSEPGYRRPILIVQSNDFNKSCIHTIAALAITSNPKLADDPGNNLLPKNMTGLSSDSVANLSQFITMDKRFLSGRLKRLPAIVMRRIDAGMRPAMSV